MPLVDGVVDDQLQEFAAVGEEVRCGLDDALRVENQPTEPWWVLLDGGIDPLRHVGHEETVLGTIDLPGRTMDLPGRWVGGFRAWDEHGAHLATGRAVTSGRVLRILAAELRRIRTARFPLGLLLRRASPGRPAPTRRWPAQREAPAALGTLAAGLAHELNRGTTSSARPAPPPLRCQNLGTDVGVTRHRRMRPGPELPPASDRPQRRVPGLRATSMAPPRWRQEQP